MAEKFFVAGIGYGDEGKGSIVDFLAEYLGSGIVVRYNGGSQAAHHVVHDGITHCFSQFGSGTFSDGVKTYLSKYMLVDPLTLMVEEEALSQKGINDAYERLYIDQDCLVITPMQKIAGQMRELSNRNGSCGMGVGETAKDSRYLNGASLKIGDLQDENTLLHKLDYLWRYKLDQAEQLLDENPSDPEMRALFEKISSPDLVKRISELYADFTSKANIVSGLAIPSQSIFEGAQGVLLDRRYGFFPYITKTDTTFANAHSLVEAAGKSATEKSTAEKPAAGESDSIARIGVLRAYGTRHGAGPFVTEDILLAKQIPDHHNGKHRWQGDFRVGWLDLLATRYALEAVGGVDSIALTNIDRLQEISPTGPINICTSYQYDGNGLNGDEDISAFFDYDNVGGRKLISRIKVQESPTPENQQKLAELLFKCSPVYTGFDSRDENRFISFLESGDGLATPISIISRGPERKDKQVIKEFQTPK
jgi:adenylosuccinate synthase